MNQFDFIVSGFIKNGNWSERVVIPVTVDKPSLDLALETAKSKYLTNYVFELSTVKPMLDGLEKSLEYKEQVLQIK